jgi:hypothetical protein
MQIHRAFISLAMLALCRTTLAQEPLAGLADEATRGRAFLPVYMRYIDAINTRGVDGLKDLTASNFIVKWDRDSRTGAKAFQYLKTHILDPRKGDEVLTAVKLRRLVFTGDRAIVQTEETQEYFFGNKPGGQSFETWIWKQTWRKTPEGWRLILWEPGDDKLPSAPVTHSYTVTWTAKSPKAAPLAPSPSGTDRATPPP